MKYLLNSNVLPEGDFLAPYAAFSEYASDNDVGSLSSVLEALNAGDASGYIPASLNSALGAPSSVLRRRRVSRLVGGVLASDYVILFDGGEEVAIDDSPNSLDRAFAVLTRTLGLSGEKATRLIGESLESGSTLI